MAPTPAFPARTPITSALFQLVETKLGTPLDKHLLAARQRGEGFNQIAYGLTAGTGVRLTHEAIRRWVRCLEEKRGLEPSVLPGHAHHSINSFDTDADQPQTTAA